MVTAPQPQTRPTIPQCLALLQALIPASLVAELACRARAPRRFYARVFTPWVVVWCLLWQRLQADHTCDALVSALHGQALDPLDTQHPRPLSQRLRSLSSSAFCQARQRLPLAVLAELLRHSGQVILAAAGETTQWCDHPLALLDGTTLSLYPHGDLAATYGQPANQYGPGFWVQLRLVGAFCLRSGALLAVAEGALQASEQALVQRLLPALTPGTLCLGDQNFGIYSVLQGAVHHGHHVLVRLTASRARALARRPLPSRLDRALCWAPSAKDQCLPELPAAPIAGRLLAVQVARPGFRPLTLYFFTTLADPQRYPLEALCQLYGERWHVELDLRYVKATLELDHLAARSADTVRKELYAGLIAYNLIRAWMQPAAQQAGLTPLNLSFTQVWRHLREGLPLLWAAGTRRTPGRAVERLLARLARCVLPPRPPQRIEPRAVRKRRLPYPPLKGARSAARQHLLAQQPAAKS